MRRNSVLIFLWLVSGVMGLSDSVREEWVARYNGLGNDLDAALAMAVDAAGNVYVTGRSRGLGFRDEYATVKYDPDGNQIWVARYNGPGDEGSRARAIAVDGEGNVYVTGESAGTDSLTDYATLRYDPDGNRIWVARYNGPANGVDVANAIAVDTQGNVYVTGGSAGNGIFNLDYATVKYDPDGNQLWVARYSGPGNGPHEATAIAVDAEGNVYVTGRSEGKGTLADYATVKYDVEGKQVWVARYNGPGNRFDAASALAIDGQGNVYVTGQSGGVDSRVDYATIKYDTDGNQIWVKRYDGPSSGSDLATAIAVDAEGNVYVTGGSEQGMFNADYATVKYDTDGNQIWVARYNGPGDGNDIASAITLDADGNVYVTGSSEGPRPEGDRPSGGGGARLDYATVKYDPDGNQVWVARYDGPANDLDQATAIALDTQGNVYVTGGSRGVDTNLDYATVKYVQQDR